MKTTTTYERGDRVRVTATGFAGICYTNKDGGTSEHPVNKPVDLTVTKAWKDGEIGRRYIGATDKGKEFYFGEFRVKTETIATA